MSTSCAQCGTVAERCDICAEQPRTGGPRLRDVAPQHLIASQIVLRVNQHRQAGRTALLIGDLDAAFDELWAARELESDLDRLGASARECVPLDWEVETDLVPLARELSARRHPHAARTWKRVLDDGPARSIQAEAAEWLARDALLHHDAREALRLLHVASRLGRAADRDALQAMYRHAGVDPMGAFALYLVAARTDSRSARATGLRDPLTGEMWCDQDARWWCADGGSITESCDHQAEALYRARDLALSKRDHGWLRLAEGDLAAATEGVRALGRTVRAGFTFARGLPCAT